MFPPASPHTERVRVELENREFEQRAAVNASPSEREKTSVVQTIIRLLTRERQPDQKSLRTKPSTSHAEQTV
jgi:hypothetical protein